MRHKFKCHACGKCCQHFFPNAEGQPPITMRDGAMNIYFTPPGEECVPLLPWEAGKLKAHAKQLGIPVNITPNIGFPSRRAKAVYIVEYVLKHSVCPFLDSNNKCSAYDVRPLVCQSFPIVDTGMVLPPLFFRKGNCPQFVNPFGQDYVYDDVDMMMTSFSQVYPEAYIARLQYEILLDYLTQLAAALHEKRFLHFSPCSEREIRQFKRIDLLSHLSRLERHDTPNGTLFLPPRQEGRMRLGVQIDPNPLDYISYILHLPPKELIQLSMGIYMKRKKEDYMKRAKEAYDANFRSRITDLTGSGKQEDIVIHIKSPNVPPHALVYLAKENRWIEVRE